MSFRWPGMRLQLLRFPLIMAMLIAMLVISNRTLTQVSGGIDAQLFSSARLEEAARVEMEWNILLARADDFARGSAAITRKDLDLALDVFWSRIDVMATGSYARVLNDGIVDESLIQELKADLPRLETALSKVRPGVPASMAALDDFIKLYRQRILVFSDEAYVQRRKFMNQAVEQRLDYIRYLKSIQFEYLIGTIAAFLYVIAELFLSQRLNSRLNRSIVEKRRLLVTDHLTGLFNRKHFETSLIVPDGRRNSPFGVVYVDLDGFKEVNDNFGHAAGDIVLRAASDAMTNLAKPEDIICRLGGDEFAAIIQGGQDRIAEFAHEAVAAIGAPLIIGSHTVRVSASVGIASSSDLAHGAGPEQLMRKADLALYAAKASGKSCVRMFTPELERATERRSQLEMSIGPAIDAELVDVAYQPVVGLDDGEVYGFEALVRWNHPVFGPIPAPHIIELAEATHRIHALTMFVVAKACELNRQINRAGGAYRSSVNISPLALSTAGFADGILAILDRFKVNPETFVLEITEDAGIDDNQNIDVNIRALRDAGMTLAVDDFGKGYSSLSRIVRLDFATLKLDKSLIDAVTTSTRSLQIVRGIGQMATDMSMRTVAEGVESREQAELLKGLGITFGQGFYFSRPINAAGLQDFILGRKLAKAQLVAKNIAMGG